MVFIRVIPSIKFPGNFRIFVVKSGSMTPTLKINDLIITQPKQSYQSGDVITFYDPSKGDSKYPTTTHRIQTIVNRNGEVFYMTKGDNNVFSDSIFVSHAKVVGQITKTIPFIGIIIALVESQIGLLLFIFLPAFLIICNEIIAIINEIKTKSLLNLQK